MRELPRAISPRLTLALIGAVATISVLVGSPQPSVGQPPSVEASIPPEAFQRVSLPEAMALPEPTAVPDSTAVPESTALSAAAAEPVPAQLPDLALGPDEVLVDPPGTDHNEADASATVSPPPAPPEGPIHVVRPGDNLWLIATWHKVELGPILTWNPGVDPRGLVAGQEILVPGGAPMPKDAVPPTPRPEPVPAGGSSGGSSPDIAPPNVSGGSGEHLWPLPVRGTITTRFSRSHPGIDVAAPAGTPVRAVADGTVTFAGWRNNGGGYVVEIRHPNGMTSTYNHNREVLVSVGQAVATGEQIAAVGSTGNSTGPHLDLRVEMGGRLVNPLRLNW